MTDFGNEDNGKIEIVFEEGSPQIYRRIYELKYNTKTDEENLKKQKEM